MDIAISGDEVIECSTYTITGTTFHKIDPVKCYTNSTKPLKALFLPNGFEFSDNKLQGASRIPMGNIPIFIYSEKVYVKIFISSNVSLNY